MSAFCTTNFDCNANDNYVCSLSQPCYLATEPEKTIGLSKNGSSGMSALHEYKTHYFGWPAWHWIAHNYHVYMPFSICSVRYEMVSLFGQNFKTQNALWILKSSEHRIAMSVIHKRLLLNVGLRQQKVNNTKSLCKPLSKIAAWASRTGDYLKTKDNRVQNQAWVNGRCKQILVFALICSERRISGT